MNSSGYQIRQEKFIRPEDIDRVRRYLDLIDRWGPAPKVPDLGDFFYLVYSGDPVAKPRMTRRDIWLDPPRPAVAKYRDFKNAFGWAAKFAGIPAGVPVAELFVRAYIPMPSSWKKSKKADLRGQPHTIKPGPDADNILKAVADALCEEDVSIWRTMIEKYWDDGSGPRLECFIRLQWEADRGEVLQ